MSSVSVVSCCYGTFARFVPRWSEYVRALDPAPDDVIVACDQPLQIPLARTIVSPCPWKHPQAWYLNLAIEVAATDWVWIVDIDDCVMRDGLVGVETFDSDVLQVGYVRSDGEECFPGLTDLRDLHLRNGLTSGSLIRVEAFRRIGGFRDVAFQDWDLWRRFLEDGSWFGFLGRATYHYMRHPYTRSETELRPELRDVHIAEMSA